MPKLDTYHSDFIEHEQQWQRCRDAVAGQDKVHAQGELYLPRLKSQDDPEYKSYKQRATFFNATGRTLDALTGMVFSASPKITVPTALDVVLEDITLGGCSLHNFAKMLVDEQVAQGRVGIIVEHPENELDMITLGEAQAMNLRPYARMYKASDIHDWREQSVNGRTQLSFVKLHEMVEVDNGDEFVTDYQEQYRILDLFEGQYRVRIFQRDPNDRKNWILIGESFPLMRGAPLDYIPFIIVNASYIGCAVDRPPLLDLVDQNLAHYRNTADYEHGLHFTGLPTPVVSGVQLEGNEKLSIGSTTAWVFPDPSAKASYLEFSGTGLSALSEAIKAKEQRMAVLGARMLSEEKRTAESTQTTMIKYAGEQSVLASIAMTAGQAIKMTLEMIADWLGVQGEISASLNTEFGTRMLTAQEITALIGAWQAGAISKQTLFQNLQVANIIQDGVEFEEEEARTETAEPEFSQEPDISEASTLLQRIRDRMGV